MVLVPSPGRQQQDLTLVDRLDTMAEGNSFSLDEPLRPRDLLRKGVSFYTEDSFSETVPGMPEISTFQDPPSQLLESQPNPCSEQQLHCSKESLKDRITEAEAEDLVPSESNTLLPSTLLWLSPTNA